MNFPKPAILLLVSILIFSSCNSENNNPETKEKVYRYSIKELSKDSIFELSQNSQKVFFEKTALAQAENSTQIIPQTSGIITKIHVKEGDKIDKNLKILSLGNSLSASANEIQLASSLEALKLAEESKNLAQNASSQTLLSAKINSETAYAAYQSALETKSNAKNLYFSQLDSAEINLKTAKDAYKDAEKAYKDAKKNLERAKETNDPELIAQAKELIATMEKAKSASKTGETLARNAIDQIKKAFESQEDQLKMAVESAFNQYRLAQNQIKSAETGADIQLTSLESQLSQIRSQVELTELNKKYFEILAPIAGTISKIYVKEGDFISPGQSLALIENLNQIILKTSVNLREAEMISINDTVKIIKDDLEFQGKISEISPVLNSSTKKIDVKILAPENFEILPNQLVKIIFSNSNENLLFIPLNALFLHEGEKHIKTITPKKFVEYKKVKIGKITGNNVEILEGISGDEKIILSTTSMIKENDLIVWKN